MPKEENYGKLPFGPRTKAAYNAGVDAGKKYKLPDIRKFLRGYLKDDKLSDEEITKKVDEIIEKGKKGGDNQ